MAKPELAALNAQHSVISTRLFAGQTVAHVLADSDPGEGFAPVLGGLEDVYFSTLAATRQAAWRARAPAMFFKIAGFEFRYQLRQPIFWIGVGIFALLAFGSVASSNIQIGSNDNVHKNAPFVLIESTLVFAVIFLFVVTAFVANVIVRDDETGFGAILRTTPIRKSDYLYGRFTGAFAAAALAFLAVPAGLWLGSVAPWVDRDTLGPFLVRDYLYAYFAVGLPILFLGAALFFSLTTVTRSMMWTYVALVGLLVLRTVFALVLSRPGLEHAAALGEPFGAGAIGEATRYWTASERTTLIPPIAGDLLWNKLIWFGVAVAALAAAYRFFDFQARARVARTRKAQALAADAETSAPPTQVGALAKPVFDARTTLAQLWARTLFDARQVFLSPAYFVLLGLAAALSVANLWLATDISAYGGRTYPVTRVMIQALDAAFTFFGIVIAIYYAGELVWREREKATHEIIDATPVGDWAFIAPKTLAISLVLFSTLAVGVVVAIATQALRGFFDLELGKYLLWYVLPNAIDLTLLAVLAIFIQAIVPHKSVGWAVMVAYLISTCRALDAGLRAQPLPVRKRTDGPAVGHERAGALLDGRLLVPAVLGRLRADPAGPGLRPLAAGDGEPFRAASTTAARAFARRDRRRAGCRRTGLCRLWRLHLLQHQRSQHLPHHARRRADAGGLREDVPTVRKSAAAEDRRGSPRLPDPPARAARARRRQLPAGQPNERADQRAARALPARRRGRQAGGRRRAADQ